MSTDCTIRYSRYKASLLGLAIGDALGAPVEFQKRGTFEPVRHYRSGGKFRLDAGEWTDDTSMALCLALSLVESQGFNPKDQLERYLKWMYHGYMSCSGKAVGIGKTCLRSLIRYRRDKKPYTDLTHEKFSGNGSLMRLAPICIYYRNNLEKTVTYAALNSKTTHGSPIAVDCCRYMAYVIWHLYRVDDKQAIFSSNFKDSIYAYFAHDPLHKAICPIIEGDFMEKSFDQIQSTGYAVHSLEAALWSFYRSNDFESAVLTAVNLGDDADTVGAITGQIAGAYYGLEGIPDNWISALSANQMIASVADAL